MYRFVFYYGGIFKREVSANSFSEAKENLVLGGSIFGIDPEDFDDYEIL